MCVVTKAFITGVTGQDGSYLTELLVAKGYVVHGLVWPAVAIEHSWLSPLAPLHGSQLFLHTGDIRDAKLLCDLLAKIHPDEIYHLAGQTHVMDSFSDPEAALDLNAMATVRLLEVVRHLNPMPRIFHASSAEIFGAPVKSPQDELTPVIPLNPYACAKAFSTQMLAVYRHTYGVFASNGILYPHESPRRGEQFLTRQVCRAAATAKLGYPGELLLGDLAAQRDWGDARDYVLGMWMALQHARPEDYVFATGQSHSVEELVGLAFGVVGLDWRRHIRRDLNYIRPADARLMVGNASKARQQLGWEPSTDLAHLIGDMVHAEMERLRTR